MDRFKGCIGNRLRARKLDNQKVEVALAADVLNPMLATARPNCVRVTATTP